MAEQFNSMAEQLQESYDHLERKVADRTRELATLNAITAEVSHSLDLRDILDNALGEVLPALSLDTGQAFRQEADETLVLMAHRGLSDRFVEGTTRLTLGETDVVKAAAVGQPILRQVADAPPGKLKELEREEGLRWTVTVPLIAKGRTVGALSLGTRGLRRLAAEELSLLAAIGQQIGVAVENARLYGKAKQLAVVKERNRLARDLHDSVTQALYGVTLYAEAATRQLQWGQADMAAGHLREIRCTAQDSLREMRLLIFELRVPALKRQGLATALRARLEAVEGRLGMATELVVKGNGQLPFRLEEDLYRIAQEALNNSLRHAKAGSVAVHLYQGKDKVALEIGDDGLGFDPVTAGEASGFGLKGIRERADQLGARLCVDSKRGEGTRIRVEVDVP
jgi:signal transduction histidine kinase